MTFVTVVAVAALAFAGLVGCYRIAFGPTDANRVAAADLLTFSVIGLVAVTGMRLGSLGTLDLVIVATLVAFLAAVSLARALTRGAR
jgi:multicomponent Na+:H+ antiporter subunit F